MRRLALPLVLGLVFAGIPVASAGSVPPPCAPGELTLLSEEALSGDGRLHQLVLDSDAMRGETGVRILLPDGYEDGAAAYPVLYLLHGAGDDETTWTTNTDVEGLVKALDLIVVMPDAGNGPPGWYSDWETDEYCWESYHVGELLPFVDATYRTLADRSGRAVAGLSMGGFGAMSYAARHPGLFGAAGSFSGAVDTADGSLAQAAVWKALGSPDDGVWGPYESNEVEWRTHNPPDLSTNLRWTDLWLRTGNGVPMPGDAPQAGPLESGVYTLNRLFHHDLESEGIDHVFLDRGYGTHEWHYWEDDLSLYLDHLFELPEGDVDGADVMDDPPDVPDAFDHRTAASDAFDVWGWSFGIDDGRAQEFLELTDVSADELTLRGSGTVTVTTPPTYEASRQHMVEASWTDGDLVTVEGGVSLSFVWSDDEGRLVFDVDLGKSHGAQQYTLEGRLAEASDLGYWRTAAVEITPVT